jgi:Bacterial conjugation TrbI-like protein
MTRGFLPIALSVLLAAGSMPVAFAASDSQLNFKIYSPDGASTAPAKADEASASTTPAEASTPAASEPATGETAAADKSNESTTVTESKPELTKEEPVMSAPATSTTADTDTAPTTPAASETTTTTTTSSTADTTGGDKADTTAEGKTETASKQTLQGYVREVPAQTKIPIIMDTAVDSDTSQEGDEFAARTAEDLTIDGNIVVPAGSIIKGRIAQLNSPKHMNRSGSVALKFDTVTTPDNRSIPLVANLVAHGGVVHAKRGLKDYAIDSGTVAAPFLIGTVIGLVAGKSNNNNTNNSSNNNNNNNSKSMSKGTAMALGAGVGLAVGVAILLAKKGKKVDVRPGDELKIELAEALRMPMM